MIKIIVLLNIIFFLYSCTTQSIYSGKIINQENLANINYKNKSTLIKKLGMPSYEDPIENKFFYFTEKKIKKSAFNEKTQYSFVFVFEFNEYNEIIKNTAYDLQNNVDVKLIKDETDNEIVNQGIIEKVFGGVGPQNELPTSP